MNKLHISISLLFLLSSMQVLKAQRGYYDAPYQRYEADTALLTNGAVATAKSYSQVALQSEASNQVCLDMTSTDATVEFSLSQPADGLVIRYSVPDGESAVIGVYDGTTKITSLTATSKWSWEYLWSNGDPNNVGITNKNPKMRFDEIRYKLPEKLTHLKLVKESGNLWLDFVEMEVVPAEVTPPVGAAVYSGNGSTLQAFIDANGAKTIFIPAGVYNINSQIYIGVDNTSLQGAGMWYSQLNFTVTTASNGGLRANAKGVSYADLFLTTDMTTRTNGYAGILGVYTQGSVIRNIWVEHTATGAWIAQYVNGGGPAYADGFLMTGCRFRNTYADGINLCKGTRNSVVEHCNFRNNGDDGIAIWSAEGLECINNTYRNNTVENVWRAAGAALYGGRDNKFYDIIIKDNVEIGITINNLFSGVGFNDKGMHVFHDITITGGGTFNDTQNSRVGSINITGASSAGTKVQNIRFYNINIDNSKCDGIRLAKISGLGIFNVSFENVTIDSTGLEYPDNNINKLTATRGHAVYFYNYPAGNATYCGLNYSRLGGNSNGLAIHTTYKGTLNWSEVTGCEPAAVAGVKLFPADTSVSGGATVQLIPAFIPANATNRLVSYTSDNPDVATVDYAGLVTSMSKGTANITVTTQDGNFQATSAITITSDPIICYKIKNRWQSTYLYDAGDRVKYTTTSTGNSYLWQIDEVDGVKEIRNYSTGDYMHIENLLSFVESTTRTPGALSSRWTFEDAGGGFIRIRNKSDNTLYMHLENLLGQAQYGTSEPTWWSAMWALERVNINTSVKNHLAEKTACLYPNPTKGDFTISLSNFAFGENVSVSIFNMTGQAMFSGSYKVDGTGFVNVSLKTENLLPPGNYCVVAKGNSLVERAKLMIYR